MNNATLNRAIQKIKKGEGVNLQLIQFFLEELLARRKNDEDVSLILNDVIKVLGKTVK